MTEIVAPILIEFAYKLDFIERFLLGVKIHRYGKNKGRVFVHRKSFTNFLAVFLKKTPV